MQTWDRNLTVKLSNFGGFSWNMWLVLTFQWLIHQIGQTCHVYVTRPLKSTFRCFLKIHWGNFPKPKVISFTYQWQSNGIAKSDSHASHTEEHQGGNNQQFYLVFENLSPDTFYTTPIHIHSGNTTKGQSLRKDVGHLFFYFAVPSMSPHHFHSYL